MTKGTVAARMQGMTAALAASLLLAGCGGGDGSGAPPATGGTPTPTPTAAPPAIVGGERQIGQWRELIIGNDGAINRSEYIRVANNYNTPEIMDYRDRKSVV